MATTQTVLGIDQLKGPNVGFALHFYRFTVQLAGTYLTGSKPNFDMAAALANSHEGITLINVKRATLANDFYDGTTKYTAPNANIALTSTGVHTNNVLTFRVDATDATHSDGDTNTEVADATALNGVFQFVAAMLVTGA